MNPDGNPDPDTGGEKRLGLLLAGWLSEAGFDIEWREKVPGRPNLVARMGKAGAAKSLMFEAHLDTVGVDWMTIPPFDPIERDGRLYGRGACDTKGPMAAALSALMDPDVRRAVAGCGGAVYFVGAMGEEKGNQGALDLVADGVGADEAVILEPTGLDVVHAHKGALWLRLRVKGRSVHGARPRDGISAIEGAWRAVEALRRMTDEAAARYHDPVLGRPTLNVGVMRGGSAVNVVPADCVVELDRRVLPCEDMEAIGRDWDRQLAALRRDGAFVDCRVETMTAHGPVWTDPEGPLVRRMLRAAAAAGCSSVPAGAAWYSDAGAFSRTCREVAVFGPGHIEQAHTAEEFIDLGELRAGRELLKAMLLDWASGAP